MKKKVAKGFFMMIQAALILLICVSCTPAEVAVIEEATQEAIILEHDIFDVPVEKSDCEAGSDAKEYC